MAELLSCSQCGGKVSVPNMEQVNSPLCCPDCNAPLQIKNQDGSPEPEAPNQPAITDTEVDTTLQTSNSMPNENAKERIHQLLESNELFTLKKLLAELRAKKLWGPALDKVKKRVDRQVANSRQELLTAETMMLAGEYEAVFDLTGRILLTTTDFSEAKQLREQARKTIEGSHRRTRRQWYAFYLAVASIVLTIGVAGFLTRDSWLHRFVNVDNDPQLETSTSVSIPKQTDMGQKDGVLSSQESTNQGTVASNDDQRNSNEGEYNAIDSSSDAKGNRDDANNKAISVVNRDNPIEIEKVITTDSGPRLRAFIFGPSQYGALGNLKYTGNDAVKLSELLAKQVPNPTEQIKTFANIGDGKYAAPNSQALRTELKKMLDDVKENDTVIFFFSGHGVRDEQGVSYLCPTDVDLDRLPETALSINELAQWLNQCQAKLKIGFLDACHSGGGSNKAISVRMKKVDGQQIVNKLQNVKNMFVAASSQGEQESFEDPNSKHGFFTRRLLEVLSGTAGNYAPLKQISVTEVWDYLNDTVKDDAKKMGHEQVPVFKLNFNTVGKPTVLSLRGEVKLDPFKAIPKIDAPVPEFLEKDWPEPGVISTNNVHKNDSVLALAIDPNDEFVLSASSNTIVAWDIVGGKQMGLTLLPWMRGSNFTQVVLSSDSSMFVACSRGYNKSRRVDFYKTIGAIYLESIFTNENPVDVAFTRDNETILLGDEKGTLYGIRKQNGVWLDDWNQAQSDIPGRVAIVENRKGSYAVAGCNDGTINSYHLNDKGSTDKSIGGMRGYVVVDLQVSEDGEWLAAAGVNRDGQAQCIIWHFSDAKIVFQRKFGKNVGRYDGYQYNSVAISRDFRRVFMGHEDGSVTLWDLKEGNGSPQMIWRTRGEEMHRKMVREVKFSHNGYVAVSGGDDGQVKCYALPRDE